MRVSFLSNRFSEQFRSVLVRACGHLHSIRSWYKDDQCIITMREGTGRMEASSQNCNNKVIILTYMQVAGARLIVLPQKVQLMSFSETLWLFQQNQLKSTPSP